MKIKEVVLYRLHMTLNNPFTTSFGTVRHKDFFLIEVKDESGKTGYGESVQFAIPWYTEETTETVFHMMEQFLIPQLLGRTITHPDKVSVLFQTVKRNHMAKAALEGAVWDLYAKRKGRPLYQLLGGVRNKVEVGISLGMEEKITDLLQKIDTYVQKGYKRVKIKVNRDQDITVLKEIRRHFPDVPLMVDANSAYTLEDLDHLRRFDEFGLLMIEQPLAEDDIFDHAIVQREIETPICLDESIHSYTDVKLAVALGSCRVINIKQGRVGGLSVAKQMHDYCAANDLKVWVGGMLDGGVGRAQNIALATLQQFTFPGDIGASSHYWERDIIIPEVEVVDGTIRLSDRPGIGYDIDWEAVDYYCVDKRTYS